MGCYNHNFIDDTIFEFPRTGFWLIHMLGALAIFWLGVRFALHRVHFPIMMYRLLRPLLHR